MRIRPNARHGDRRPLISGLGRVAIWLGLAALASGPAAAQLVTGISCTPATVNAPGTSLCTISMDSNALLGGLPVNLQSSDYNATVPLTVLVPPGTSSAQFTATVGPISVDQDTLVIAYVGDSAQSFELAMVAPVQLLGLTCSAALLTAGQSTTCTVTLNKPAPSTVAVSLSSSTPNLVVPANLMIPVGAISATFSATAGTIGSYQIATLTAQWGTFITTSINLGAPTASGLAVIGVADAANGWSTNNCSTGSWRTVTGGGFTSQPVQATGVVTTLGGLQVTVNGAPAPLQFASNSLITFQCPTLPAGSSLQVEVTTATGSASVPIQTVVPAAPAIFVVDGARNDQGLVLIGNSNVLAMPLTAGISSAPAIRGGYVSIFATGLGDVQGTTPALAVNPVQVWIGGIAVTPSFAGAAQSADGVFQIVAQIPLNLTPGISIPLYIEVVLPNGQSLPSNQVTIAVD